jgi:hypothetical protein
VPGPFIHSRNASCVVGIIACLRAKAQILPVSLCWISGVWVLRAISCGGPHFAIGR